MVVWVNAAPRMQAGARRSKKEKTALEKAVSGILLPLYYGGLNGCSASMYFIRDEKHYESLLGDNKLLRFI